MNIKRVVLGLITVGAIAIALVFFAYQRTQAQPPENVAGLIEYLRPNPERKFQEITHSLLPVLQHQVNYQYRTFEETLDHYRRYFDTLAANYPAGTFTFQADAVLKRFSGSKTVDNVSGFFSPYYLICAQIYDPHRIRYDRFEVSFEGQTIPALRITSVIHPMLLTSTGTVLVPLLEAESLNARIFGFTHAQLVLPLSKNVRPADQFSYNGLHPWEKHRRYRQLDQVLKPIRLTNYAHPSGEHYLVSDHPDFALELENYRTEAAVLTFFLWNRGWMESQLDRIAELPQQLPDFILEVRFNTPKPHAALQIQPSTK